MLCCVFGIFANKISKIFKPNYFRKFGLNGVSPLSMRLSSRHSMQTFSYCSRAMLWKQSTNHCVHFISCLVILYMAVQKLAFGFLKRCTEDWTLWSHSEVSTCFKIPTTYLKKNSSDLDLSQKSSFELRIREKSQIRGIFSSWTNNGKWQSVWQIVRTMDNDHSFTTKDTVIHHITLICMILGDFH